QPRRGARSVPVPGTVTAIAPAPTAWPETRLKRLVTASYTTVAAVQATPPATTARMAACTAAATAASDAVPVRLRPVRFCGPEPRSRVREPFATAVYVASDLTAVFPNTFGATA